MTAKWHDRAWQEWRSAMNGPRMHHAWLLAGKKGLGKTEFALAAAAELVGHGPLGDDEHHPDIIYLDHPPKDDKEDRKRAEGKPYERKRNITVSQIRAMQQRLTTRPTLGDKRAIIIDPADDMEKGASNALLKSLEEPPVGTVFLLVSHKPSRLLPTIRSRCRMLRFNALADEEIEQLLRNQAMDADGGTRVAATIAANGSPGVALDFVEQDLGRFLDPMRLLLENGDPDFALRGKLTEAVGARPKRETLEAVIDLARSLLLAQVAEADRASQGRMIDAHAKLVELSGQVATYNFDPGLLVAQIGTLLASAAPASERANV
ncbi:DNA polymerase III subunit delta' [Erythrobacter sp. HKB08]|uniref:DNA polymerase III subunit delta' n=1 Tax=Erythrobacter sp. HKB08 TaxID=2502843 RepID=UPI0010086CAB|nr:DNA polymerase III subunit delta' [Erythrobacter sp. HKB08]